MSLDKIPHPSDFLKGKDKEREWFVIRLNAYGACKFYSFNEYERLRFLDLKAVNSEDVKHFISCHLERYSPIDTWRVDCSYNKGANIFEYTAFRHILKKDMKEIRKLDY